MTAPYPKTLGPGGEEVAPTPVVHIDAYGAIAGSAVTLCQAASLVAGSGGTAASPTAASTTTPVMGVGARQNATIRFAGTFNSGAQLQGESLAADGIWEPFGPAITVRGTDANSYQIADNSTLRYRNTGTGSVTGLTITLG